MAFGTYEESTSIETQTVTTKDLNKLIKQYLPYKLLFSEVEKRSYFIQKVNKKNGWKGGPMPIPFENGRASSFRMGSLVADADITSNRYAKGFLEDYKELWGALKFHDHDLKRHDNLEQSFLTALLKEVPRFAESMKELLSKFLLNGPALAKVTDVTDAATGVLVVDRPEMLEIGQYVEIGSTTANKTGYVATINMNTNEVLIVTAMSDVEDATNPVDLSAATAVAVNDTFRIKDGFAADKQFISLPEQLLSAANGGLPTLFGLSKVKYPFLQAYNHSGSAITSTSILKTIFDAYGRTKVIGKMAMPSEVIMSYKNLMTAMNELELGTGADSVGQKRQFTAGDSKVNAFGWTEITVSGVKGSLKLVGINEMRDDIIYGLDWRHIDLHSNGFIERVSDANGNEFYTSRTENGYYYITDIRFFGELVVSMPSYQFVIHSINY